MIQSWQQRSARFPAEAGVLPEVIERVGTFVQRYTMHDVLDAVLQHVSSALESLAREPRQSQADHNLAQRLLDRGTRAANILTEALAAASDFDKATRPQYSGIRFRASYASEAFDLLTSLVERYSLRRVLLGLHELIEGTWDQMVAEIVRARSNQFPPGFYETGRLAGLLCRAAAAVAGL